MIQQQSIDQVLSLDVNEVISNYIPLTRRGADFKGLCPFHKENTPSFSVSPSKGIYKCFGCGKAGNAVGFVMDYKKLDFILAVKEIAANHNILLIDELNSNEATQTYNHNELLYAANKLAYDWFRDNLRDEINYSALQYVQSRWNDDMIGYFGIGYAPDTWEGLKSLAQKHGINEDILLEAGLISESNGKRYETFRGRIIFPISNSNGRIIGFTGRNFSGNQDSPKYFNTTQTSVFTKGKILYGLHLACRSIKEKGFAFLVEGNADVIRMHQVGNSNTVCCGGTSLTRDQISELKKLTNSVTIIGDSDKPGQAAVVKNGKMLLEAGMFCNVIPLPDEVNKQDPDSFFKDGAQFEADSQKHKQEYIIWQANSQKEKCKSADEKSKLVDELSFLITHLPVSSHDSYAEQLGNIFKPKKVWTDRIRQYLADKPKEEKKDKGHNIPEHVILSDYEKYGFYESGNCYYFKTSYGPKRGCNFIMVPLFHIASVINAKRIFKITNEFEFNQVIELQQKDLISLSNFKLRVESLGNFLFEGTESDLNKLKRSWYANTDSCVEIVQLGWQKGGFWAWSNGIFHGQFVETDQNGIVKHKEINYYLPSSSEVYKTEESLFISERRFKYSAGTISLYDYAEKLINVFSDNAIVSICYYFASLFHDHIVNLFGFFPILNLFGPKGTGKTELAASSLQFFGQQTKGPNITNITRAALADHVALFSNSLCHLDEYKNNLEIEKTEFLKGLWDGTGRTKMNMDKDKKKETTRVDCGIILSGQEMPTADIALFSRLIFLSFDKIEFSASEKSSFNELKELDKSGNTHITHEILQHRKLFTNNFMENYNQAAIELNNVLKNVTIEDRIFRNWLIIVAAYRTLMNVLHLPWSYGRLLEISSELIIRQNQETKKGNELSTFWDIVEFLTNDGLIREEVDFKLEHVSTLKTDKYSCETDWIQPKNVLFINHSRIFQHYRVHGQKTKENILPLKTLEHYLTHSKAYLGKKASFSFKVEENRRVVPDVEMGGDQMGPSMKKMIRKVTTAMAFDYEMLNISIIMAVNKQEPDQKTGKAHDDLPF